MSDKNYILSLFVPFFGNFFHKKNFFLAFPKAACYND